MLFPTKKNLLKTSYRNSILIACCAMLLPVVSQAQQYHDPGLLRKTVDRKPVDFQSKGIRMGSFVLKPGVELAYEHNDNIFYLGNVEISDSIMHVRPWANLSSDWNRHELNVQFYADIGRYNDYDSQDYEDWVFNLDGRIDVRRGSNFNYRAAYMQLHEDRRSPDNFGSFLPVEFTLAEVDAGYEHTFNRLTAALNYNRSENDYDDGVSLDGTILDNQDRDRTRDELRLKLGYELSGQSSAFFSVIGNSVDYDQQFDNSGFERSSDGYSLRAGMSWDDAGVLVGDLYLSYINQEYDDARFAKVDGFGLGGTLDWTPTELTSVNFRFRNGPLETTQVGTSGFFSSLYSVRLQHELRRNWLANARVSYTDNDYESTLEDEFTLTGTKVTRAGLGISYLFNRNLYISGGYVYEKQTANVDSYEYKANRWFLTLGGEL